MGTFELVSDSNEGKFAVVYKDQTSGNWGVFATVFDTEAEAGQQAATLIENNSASHARVCPPTGDFFKDTEV